MFSPRKLYELERERNALASRFADLQRQRAAELQLLDGLGEALLAIDADRRVVIANRRFIDLFGGMDHVGKRLTEVLRVADVLESFDRALGGEEVTCRFGVRSGVVERRIEMRAQPIASTTIAVVALFIDVSKIELLEQIRRNFISDFSHEVRTPLAGLRSAVETLEHNSDRLSPEDDKQLRRIMARQLRRLERLVDDLSELSRIESGDLTLDIRPVELRPILDDLVEDFAEQSVQHRVRFEVRGEGSAIADSNRLQQAFSNLIDNAIKYGGDDHRITIDIRDGEVRVSDEGEGIAPPEREKIFHRFYRIDKTIPGSGLGLAITKHLVLQQRGTIDVESKPGHGATFIVRLPRPAATPQRPSEASR
ncbi:MAG TPA: ATP-binding protein [Thermoanaerobaculia bacterium]|nr:ATP-binding protein [Thermoanaerobaculia bacterium]